MKIDQYIKQYSCGERFYFGYVLGELAEFLVEIAKLNKKGVIEEFRDVCVYFQIWLYFRFGINGKVWKINMKAAEKYKARQAVWRKIYSFVGLDEDICGYAGNYMKVEKVIDQLARFGISEDRARGAYRKIVLENK